MGKIQHKNLQAAQGMVEFALVLPLLLMLVFGIFAFGHLLFAYSSVVSASRDAARWAAAIGEPGISTPRYKDCNAIMAAAVRVGSFAGVAARDPSPVSQTTNDPGIVIWYDTGPGKAQKGSFCQVGTTGQDVDLGDRINVRVIVMYRPIVPLVNIPSFPLVATTARTIIRGVSVGAAPTAEAACNWTAIHMTVTYGGVDYLSPPPPDLVYKVVVSEPVMFTFEVASPNGLLTKGRLDLTIEGTKYSYTPPSGSKTYQFTTVGTGAAAKVVQADYFPDTQANMGGCYQLSTISVPIDVGQASTSIVVFTDPANPSVDLPSVPGNTQVPVYFKLTPQFPGVTPTGAVIIWDRTTGSQRTVQLTAGPNVTINNVDNSITGRAYFTWLSAGIYQLYAIYGGDTKFLTSTSTPDFPHTVAAPKPICPSITQGTLLSNGLDLKVVNPIGGTTTQINQVGIQWLQDVNGTPPLSISKICTTTEATCALKSGLVWSAPQLVLQPPVPAKSTDPGWDGSSTSMAPTNTASASIDLYLFFNKALIANGSYTITLYFDNGCGADGSISKTLP